MQLTWNRTATRACFTALALGATAALLMTSPHAQEKKYDEVPYVPTPQNVVDKMLELAQVKEGDVVYDLGCGDGRIIVTAAAKFGATGVGVDIDPERIRESNENARKAGVSEKVKFIQEDLFKTNFGEADVLALYLFPKVNLKLRPKIQSEMKPGSRVVAHVFHMGDWKADQKVEVGSRMIYFWVVPARVRGTWRAEISGKPCDFVIAQKHQTFTGAEAAGGAARQIVDGKIVGKTLTFTLIDPGAANGGTTYTATFNDYGILSGHAQGDEEATFTAKCASA